MSGPRLIEMAGPERVRSLMHAPNAVVSLVRKTRAIAAIELLSYGDDSRRKPAQDNPQKLSVVTETDDNPRGVWMLKHLLLVDIRRERGSCH